MAKAFGSIAGRALRTAEGRNDSRTAMMKAIRAACRRLDIDDDERREIQQELTGVKSMSDMTLAQLGQMLDRLNKGWKRPMGHRAHIAKIRALWWTLYWLGEIDQPNDRGVSAFVERQTGIGALRFLAHHQAASVVEGLKAWCARAGVRWPTQAAIAGTVSYHPGYTLQMAERHAVLDAIAHRLRDLRVLTDSHIRYVQAALKLGPNHFAWTAHELDAAIKLLGKRLRRQLDKAVDE